MKPHDYEILCARVRELCQHTALFLREECSHFTREKIELKGPNDFVSVVDKEAERRLVTGLKALLPEAGFITEEGTTVRSVKEHTWIIDPLDGTTNFIHGVPCYAISIALHHSDQPVIGVIYEVNQNECFYTWLGGPAYLNGKTIHVSTAAVLSESLIATGFPNRFYEHMDAYMALLKDLMFDTHGIRRFGSAAVDLAYVACGRCEAFYEYGLSPWDVAAGAFIVQNAGGKVTDFGGGTDYIFGKTIMASNEKTHESLLKKLQEHFTTSHS